MKRIFFLLSFMLSTFMSVQCARLNHQPSKITAANNKPDSVNFVWTNTMSGANCVAVAADAKGNSYVTGNMGGTATFDAIKLKALGVSDVFLAKYDPNGYCVWATHAGSLIHNSQSYVEGITVDAEGNSYITGSTFGSVVFDTIPLFVPHDKGNIFTAKYSPEGKCLWARLDLAGGSKFGGIAVDSHGNCYVSGSFDEWANFGSFQLKGSIFNPFIAKFDSKGQCVWAEKLEQGMGRGESISIDNSDNFYIIGYFSWQGIVGSNKLHSKNVGSHNTYVTKFDADGKCLWAQQACYADSNGNLRGTSIAIDAGGNSYITGSFEGTASFGSSQIKSHGERDIFVAKYDPSGNYLWTKSAGGKFDDDGEGLTVDSDGNCYVIGTFTGAVEFDSLSLNKDNFARGHNMFIAKYDNYGIRKWVKFVGGNTDAQGKSISSDINGNLYVVGKYMSADNPVKLGTSLLYGYGQFLSKLNSSGIEVEKPLESIPLEYSVQINYPLPEIPGVQIKFDLPYDSRSEISIYDTAGKYIDYFLPGDNLKKGTHLENYYCYNLSDGRYDFRVQLTSNDHKHKFKTHKEIFLKKLISPGLNYQLGKVDVPFEIKLYFRQIVRYIKENNAKEISNLISYPLARLYPLKEIKDSKEFISYYSVIFDQTFIKKLNQYDDSQITRDGKYELFGLTRSPFKGDIWIGTDGKIYSIDYLSAGEKILKIEAINKIKSQMYPSVRDWNDNIIFAKAGKLLIRIDTTDKGFRYVSWSNGHKMSNKPDLILFNGVEGKNVEAPGRTYTFINEKWTYIVEYYEPDEDYTYSDNTDDGSGWYLSILHNNVQKNSIKLNEVK